MALARASPFKAHSLIILFLSLFDLSTAAALFPRGSPAENNILANCVDQNGVKSSQMAYFIGAVNSSPDAVATVPTSPGLTRVWEGTGAVSATFQDGDVFTVTIPSPVPNGAYAGPGSNNYGPFSCWYNYKPNVYNWGGNSCDMIYDCNHEAAPASTAAATSTLMTGVPTSTPAATSTDAATTAATTAATAAATAAASTASTANSSQPASPTQPSLSTNGNGNGNGNKGLGPGDIAGITIGVVSAVAAIAALVVAALDRWKSLHRSP
jgi:hypothetical protein